VTAYCERQLANREWCVRPERHRGPHMDYNHRTNADNRRHPAPETTCEVCQHYARANHPCRFERACSCWYGVPCHGTGAPYRAVTP
jgi:hypothetical protein